MININEDSWIEVNNYIQEELKKCRKRLESESIDYSTTQYIRGKIFSLRKISHLPYEKEPIKIEEY